MEGGTIAAGPTIPTNISSSDGNSNGFFVNGLGDFLIGSGSGYGMKYDASEDQFSISSSNFLFGDKVNNNAFISGADNQLEISSSKFHLLPSDEKF